MSSPPERGFVLIAALSGRALAAAAVRSGYRPLVADLFADLDTAELAAAAERVPGSLARGFRGSALLAALDRLAVGRSPAGVVCGAGFEDRTALLAAIGRRHRLLGNPPATVRAVKQPDRLAALCARVGVRIRGSRSDWGTGRGRAGVGWRSAWAAQAACMSGRSKPGPARAPDAMHRPASPGVRFALVLADAKRALVLGFSEQWCAPTPAGRSATAARSGQRPCPRRSHTRCARRRYGWSPAPDSSD